MSTNKRVVKLKEGLTSKGMNPKRPMLAWVSGSEGERFIEVGQKVEQLGLDEDEIEMTIRTFSKDDQNGLIQEI
jgi:hypothetical protein